MQFAVVKVLFEYEEGAPVPDRKELQSLVEKLRAKFRIVVMPISAQGDEGQTAIAYASLAISAEALNKQLDAISAFCEEQGFGRIADEAVLMDDIDSIGQDLS